MHYPDPSPSDDDPAGGPSEPGLGDAGRRAPPLSLCPVCSRCGSDALVRDACATWSVPDQRWELAGTYDSTTCQDCEAEADDLADWRPLGPDDVRGFEPPQLGVAMIYHPGTGTLFAAAEALMVRLDLTTDDEDGEEIAARLHAGGASTPLDVLARDASAMPD